MGDLRIRVFNRQGKPLDELSGEITRSWTANDIGTFKMKIGRNDPKATQENLSFGNLILIESSLMPNSPWGGFIWTPRNWSEETIEVEGKTGEGLLKQRVMLTQLTQTPRTAEALFIELINEGNRRGDTSIRINPSDVEIISPKVYEDTFYGMFIFDAIEDLRKRSSFIWWLEPRTDSDNSIFFQAHCARNRKERGHQMVMHYNVVPAQSSVMTEAGDITTGVLVIGQGETLETTPTSYETLPKNHAEFRRWGLREGLVTGNFKTQGAALGMAKSFLTREGRVKRYYSVDAPFMDDPLISTLHLGSEHLLFVGGYGFTEDGVEAETRVTVKGMALSEKEGKVALVVQAKDNDMDFIER